MGHLSDTSCTIRRADRPAGRAKMRLAAVVLAAGIATNLLGGGAFAWLLNSMQNRDNAFASGTLAVGTDPAASFIGMQNMKPGDSVTKPIKVMSTGSMPMKFRLKAAKQDGTDTLFKVMTAKLVYTGPDEALKGTVVYDGLLWELGQNSDIGGNLDAAGTVYDPALGNHGDFAEYDLTVGLPTTATDSSAGKSASLKMLIDATQIDNPAWAE